MKTSTESYHVTRVQYFRTGTRFEYGLENLDQCDKRVKTESQKVLRNDFYIWKSYSGKTGSEVLFCLPLLASPS